MLRELPADQVKVVQLAYFGGLTHSEIADVLGMPLGTVKGRMRLAMDKMRAQSGGGRVNEHDHQPFEDDLAAYMLDALPGDEARRFERHLDSCPRCQERARWLQPSLEMLPAAVEQVEPPPALRERLMVTVRAEAEQAGRAAAPPQG